VESAPVSIKYEVAVATNDGQTVKGGFDGKGDALPAEMLPGEIKFNDVTFKLGPAKTGAPNAIVAKGQTASLPAGSFNRVYILAASVDGDQKATFTVGSNKAELNIQDWGGFIGQWDDRTWSGTDLAANNAKYGEMLGLKPGFIKRADLAWYSDHYHDAQGQNATYRYAYLFGYGIDVPAGAKSITLPKNDKIRILAISVANENPDVKAAQPLYDVLPAPNAHPEQSGLPYLQDTQNSTATK
jgi:alpha-mannosidase